MLENSESAHPGCSWRDDKKARFLAPPEPSLSGLLLPLTFWSGTRFAGLVIPRKTLRTCFFYLFFNTANWLDQIPMVLEITLVFAFAEHFFPRKYNKIGKQNFAFGFTFSNTFFCFSNFFAKLAVVLAKSLVGWRKLHENARTHTRSKTDFFTEKPHFWPCLGLLDLHVFFARVLLPECTITIYYRGKGGGSTNANLVNVVEHTHTLGQTEIVTLQLYCLRG